MRKNAELAIRDTLFLYGEALDTDELLTRLQAFHHAVQGMFKKARRARGRQRPPFFCMGEVIAMGKHKPLAKLARGHEWAAGRPTQTHGDKRHKRLRNRSARLRRALKEEW